jgi:hypothetical protein
VRTVSRGRQEIDGIKKTARRGVIERRKRFYEEYEGFY